MLGLLCLPYEVLANIVENIDFDDVFNLAQVGKGLKFLIIEESISKRIVQVSKFHLFVVRWGILGVRLPKFNC